VLEGHDDSFGAETGTGSQVLLGALYDSTEGDPSR
jgi:hypothetical protein